MAGSPPSSIGASITFSLALAEVSSGTASVSVFLLLSMPEVAAGVEAKVATSAQGSLCLLLFAFTATASFCTGSASSLAVPLVFFLVGFTATASFPGTGSSAVVSVPLDFFY